MALEKNVKSYGSLGISLTEVASNTTVYAFPMAKLKKKSDHTKYWQPYLN